MSPRRTKSCCLVPFQCLREGQLFSCLFLLCLSQKLSATIQNVLQVQIITVIKLPWDLLKMKEGKFASLWNRHVFCECERNVASSSVHRYLREMFILQTWIWHMWFSLCALSLCTDAAYGFNGVVHPQMKVHVFYPQLRQVHLASSWLIIKTKNWQAWRLGLYWVLCVLWVNYVFSCECESHCEKSINRKQWKSFLLFLHMLIKPDAIFSSCEI